MSEAVELSQNLYNKNMLWHLMSSLVQAVTEIAGVLSS